MNIREERDRLSASLQVRGEGALVGRERDAARQLIGQYNYQLRQQQRLDGQLGARAFLRGRQ